MRRILSVLGLLVAFSGCMVDSGADGGSGGGMTRSKVCVAEGECNQCQSACSVCLDACFDATMSGASLNCDSSGSSNCSRDCTHACREPTTCEQWGYDFQLPAADKSVQQSCEAAVAKQVACGASNLEANCAHYARVEAPISKQYYECHAAAACGSDAAACNPPAGSIGTEVCAAVDELCGGGTCPAELREALNSNAGWLRPDVLSAVRGCFTEPSCGDRANCVDAWIVAVYPAQ
ncbi:MAG TPA: hypothetical protein PKD61_26690 [Polyangiaceae bacterium]|nr:hypothetical protein [Polyangiaceae bacterium]